MDDFVNSKKEEISIGQFLLFIIASNLMQVAVTDLRWFDIQKTWENLNKTYTDIFNWA